MVRNHSVVPYICDENVLMLASWNIHERVQSGEKPFNCSKCDQMVPLLSLNIHKIAHNGEKPFSCSTCDENSLMLPNLNFHERVHNGEKP